MSRITVAYKPENHAVGELFVSGHVGDFAGKSSAWFNRTQVEDFGTALARHPFDPNDPPSLAGGEFTEDGSLKAVWAGILIRPWSTTGQLVVEVVLSQTEVNSLRRSATFDFLTDYTAVDAFRSELVSMMSGEAVEATLTGTYS